LTLKGIAWKPSLVYNRTVIDRIGELSIVIHDHFYARAPRFNLRRPAQWVRLASLLAVIVILTFFASKAVPGWLLALWLVANLAAWGWELYGNTRKRSPQLLFHASNTFRRRHYVRVSLFAGAILFNFVLLLALSHPSVREVDLIGLLLAFYSMMTFAWLEYEAMRWTPGGQNLYIWNALSVALGAAVYLKIRDVHDDVALGIGVLITLMAVVVYVMQRLGSEDRVLADVLSDLIKRILGVSHMQDEWNSIVEEIRSRLRYERVFILEPNMDRSALVVVAEAGNYPSVQTKSLPIQEGITGKAFLGGEPLAWNDTAKCGYYECLVPKELDDTRAEIAIPIQHNGITYGVLDIQDTHPNIFRWENVRSLEVIARILGAAISSQKTDLLVKEAYNLWEELSSRSYSQEAIFDEFACFAQDKLGADVIVYYPLTPTGFPARPPLCYGELNDPEQMADSIQDLRSPLIHLIDQWHPYFADKIYPDSVFAQFVRQDPPSFSIREEIQSACFIPVGTPKERLGAMFLNYRQERRFDGLFRFMILSFSQTFAVLSSRELYKSILFEGFGRPELGVHNLFGRYGLKTGVSEEGEKIFQRSCIAERTTSFTDCGMSELFQRMDGFLRAVSLAQSSIPPMFWRESLQDELQEFASTLPARQDGRRPATELNVDPKIEREGPWVKLALYRLITEAMNNAVFHGDTGEIRVSVARRENAIHVRVANDGNPLPADAGVRRSRRGIYSLLQGLSLKFDASTNIARGEDGTGTVVEVQFPAIPCDIGGVGNYESE